MMVMLILNISHGCCSQTSRDVLAVYGAFSERNAQVAQLLMAHLAEHEVELLARNLSVSVDQGEPISFMLFSTSTLPKTNIAPKNWLRMVVSNRDLLFQGSTFRGYVSFREGIHFFPNMFLNMQTWKTSLNSRLPCPNYTPGSSNIAGRNGWTRIESICFPIENGWYSSQLCWLEGTFFAKWFPPLKLT